jgi:hypothetical protein
MDFTICLTGKQFIRRKYQLLGNGLLVGMGNSDRGQLCTKEGHEPVLIPQKLDLLCKHKIKKVLCGESFGLALSGLMLV